MDFWLLQSILWTVSVEDRVNSPWDHQKLLTYTLRMVLDIHTWRTGDCSSIVRVVLAYPRFSRHRRVFKWSRTFVAHSLATELGHRLTAEQGVFVVRRLENDMKLSAAGETFKTQYLLQSLTDWKTWVASMFSRSSFNGMVFIWYVGTVGIFMGLWVLCLPFVNLTLTLKR